MLRVALPLNELMFDLPNSSYPMIEAGNQQKGTQGSLLNPPFIVN